MADTQRNTCRKGDVFCLHFMQHSTCMRDVGASLNGSFSLTQWNDIEISVVKGPGVIVLLQGYVGKLSFVFSDLR